MSTFKTRATGTPPQTSTQTVGTSAPSGPGPFDGWDFEKIPFGKHKGALVHQLPHDYMRWCIDNIFLTQNIRLVMEYCLGLPYHSTAKPPRQAYPPQPPKSNKRTTAPPPETVAPPAAQISSVRGLVKLWYRRMSLRFHPDRGGSQDQQVVVNECYRVLLEELERWEASQNGKHRA